MARGAIAIVLQTPAPEGNEPPDATSQPTLAPEPLVTTTPVEGANGPASAPHESTAMQVVAARDGDAPPGGWGQSFAKPLVADESALATLHARFRGVRAIAIDVDASGRATHVAIPESVTGEARADLARTLLALRYVPAECNGLRCVGTLQLAL